jgi:H+/Cl- antiporter ClcA
MAIGATFGRMVGMLVKAMYRYGVMAPPCPLTQEMVLLGPIQRLGYSSSVPQMYPVSHPEPMLS